MTTMNISVTDDMKSFVETQLANEGFATASEYLRALIREAQKRQARRELDATLLAGLQSGPATPMTRDDWDTIERDALEGQPVETIRS